MSDLAGLCSLNLLPVNGLIDYRIMFLIFKVSNLLPQRKENLKVSLEVKYCKFQKK